MQNDALRRIDESADKIWKDRDYAHLQALLQEIAEQSLDDLSSDAGSAVYTGTYPSMYGNLTAQGWSDVFDLPETQYSLIASLGYHIGDDERYAEQFAELDQLYLPRIETLIESYSGLRMPGDEDLIARAVDLFNEYDLDMIGDYTDHLWRLRKEKNNKLDENSESG